MFEFIQYLLPYVAVVGFIVAIIASVHAVLSKRDTRATITWVGLIWLSPLIGSFLYVWLGVNRIERRARRLRRFQRPASSSAIPQPCTTEEIDRAFSTDRAHLKSVPKLVDSVTGLPLLPGNHLQPLIDGDEAYPAMLKAIDEAESSVGLSTYIFDNDVVGTKFHDALLRAHQRGVDVRVIIDDMGSRYSWARMSGKLRRAGIRCELFMPTLVPWTFHYSNLRTHRKLLTIDGKVGFTGGMNIRAGHWLSSNPRSPVRDIHFRVEGPVVSHIQEVFADDWWFCTGEAIDGENWFPNLQPAGTVLARGIPDGPDETLESFQLALLGAIAAAESSVRVVTPYFVPESSLITALSVAALRGIRVDVVLPGLNNIAVVHWASMSVVRQIVERGCHVWMSPAPFDHTKLMVVDEIITFVGSSNWDARSLRLNFEFNLECYDRPLASQINAIINERISKARRVTLNELDERSFPVKLRDGLAKLASPYL